MVGGDYTTIATLNDTEHYEWSDGTTDPVKINWSTSCFAKGTQIALANNTTKNIEDIVEGDEVLTFNHLNGAYEAQKVYLAHKGDHKANAVTLHFNNNETITVVGEHDLFNQEELTYVTITNENAVNYIGKHFYNTNDGYVELVEVTEVKDVEYYSIYTEYNANCIANNMLTVPDDDDERLQIFNFNEDLTIDHEQLDKDIAQYGLFETEEFTAEQHETMGVKYVNIMVGKGLVTIEELEARMQ